MNKYPILLERTVLDSSEISINFGGYSSYASILFMATANKNKMRTFTGRFKTPNCSLLGDRQFVDLDDNAGSVYEIIFDPKLSVLFSYNYDRSNSIRAQFVGKTVEEIDQKIADFEKLLERIPEDSDKIAFTFWFFSQAQKGPATRIRSVVVPTWKGISQNYNAKTFQSLNTLMISRPAMDDGKLLLWNGEAGTGKTFAIRTLANAWKSWCQFDYIIDPEALFNNSDYMIEAALQEGRSSIDAPTSGSGRGPSAAAEKPSATSSKWRCLVLEDCGEMIAMDSKEKIGQALARLLNLADGLLGQGLEIMFLITTNDELGKLHPAVSRVGRCFSHIEFGKLSTEECNKWLPAHGAENSVVSSPHTLSDLYGIVRQSKSPDETSPKIGFRPSGNGNLVIGPQNI